MLFVENLKSQTICHLLIAMAFFSCGLLCNVIQLLLLVCVRPVSSALCQKLMYYPCYSFFAQLVGILEWYGGGKVRVFMDPDVESSYVGKDHGLMIMNHTYEIDWMCSWMFLDKFKVLGTFKAFAKTSLRYMPVLGWAWYLIGFVFLKRDFEKDKDIIASQLKEVFANPHPTWLLLNAEGTRFTAEKHEASVKFAQQRGMTALKYHLIPRTRGFTSSLSTLRGICPAIYDINMVFKRDSQVPVTLDSVVHGKPLEPYVFIRRIPLDEVPQDKKEAAAWLHNLYAEKDRIVDSFHETGSFFQNSGIKEVPCKLHHPRPISLINFGFMLVFSSLSILYFLISSLLNANWIGLIFIMIVFLMFFLLLKKATDMSEISKASTYGVSAEGKTKAN